MLLPYNIYPITHSRASSAERTIDAHWVQPISSTVMSAAVTCSGATSWIAGGKGTPSAVSYAYNNRRNPPKSRRVIGVMVVSAVHHAGIHTRNAGTMAPRPGQILPWVILALIQGVGTSFGTLASTAARHSTSHAASSRIIGTGKSLSMSATGPAAAAPEGAVIVGGGPSGLATALMLAKRGWSDISVIERTPSADYFDPRVAFV